MHFIAAVIQLSPFVDLVQVAWSGTDAQDPEQRRAARHRDLQIKKFESAPQALFQSYVFFAMASHKQPLNILSIAISILSLSLGFVEFYMEKEEHVRADANAEDSADPTRWSVQADVLGAKEEGIILQADGAGSLPVDITRSEPMRASAVSECSSASIPKLRIQVQMDRPDSPVKLLSAGKFVAFLYMGSDLALRCVASAVNFSPSARFPGVAIAVSYICLFILRHPANLAILRARGEICHRIQMGKRSEMVSKDEMELPFDTKPVEDSSRSCSSICLAVTRIVVLIVLWWP